MFHAKININGTDYPLAVNITGAGAPTSSTAAAVGMFYMDDTTGEVYKCTAVSGNTYVWVPFLNIVQITGDGEKVVMSQKAVTNELVRIGASVSTVADRVSILEKANEGNTYDFITDNTVAYAKHIPPNALPYATLDKVGGMISKNTKQENILPNGYVALSDGGDSGGSVTYNAEDNSFTFDGYFSGASETVLLDHSTPFALPSGTYTFEISGEATGLLEVIVEAKKNGEVIYSYDNYEATVTFDLPDGADSIYLAFDDAGSVGFSNLKVIPRLLGEVVELVDAPVTSIKVQGKNFCKALSIESTKMGVKFKHLGDGGINVNGVASGLAMSYITSAEGITLPVGRYTKSVRFNDGSYADALKTNVIFVVNRMILNEQGKWVNDGTYHTGNQTFDVPEGEYQFRFYLQVNDGGTVNDVTIYPQVERGEEVTDFAPYTETTYPIPEAVQQLDGYGLRISDTLHNYIDFENKTFVRMVAKRAWKDGDVNSDTMLTDGTETVYALDAVETVDISGTLDFDESIAVQGGGFIYFENDLKIATPNTVTYQVKL